MKALINSIYLSSLYYMNSNNITMHKFGIENNYISMAMNSMLGKTNNTVKNVKINSTNAMVIDNNWGCILSVLSEIGGWIAVIAAAAVLLTNPVGWALLVAIATFGFGAFSVVKNVFSMTHTCPWPYGEAGMP